MAGNKDKVKEEVIPEKINFEFLVEKFYEGYGPEGTENARTTAKKLITEFLKQEICNSDCFSEYNTIYLLIHR